MWAPAAQITAWYERVTACRPSTFAAVPLKTSHGRACSPKCCSKDRVGLLSVGVLAVAPRMADVGPGDRLEHLGVDPGIVVAGKAALDGH